MTRKEDRRKLVAGSVILVFLASLLIVAAGAAAGNKVTVCHQTPPDNSNGQGQPPHEFVLITISVNALPAHEAHGDSIFVDGSCDGGGPPPA
ncbi:MAG: hypothetical protein V3T72_09670 [Thermoanaerobaculia bacterium]